VYIKGDKAVPPVAIMSHDNNSKIIMSGSSQYFLRAARNWKNSIRYSIYYMLF